MTDITDLSEELAKEATHKCDALRTACQSAGITLPKDPTFLTSLKRVLVFSDFIAKRFTANPELLQDLINSGDLEREYTKGEYENKVRSVTSGLSSSEDEGELCRVLRRLRLQEMIRIAWRDLVNSADLSMTMNDLSDFADACIGHALCLLYDWHCLEFGIPIGLNGSRQQLVVIGMGKLGGHELNFSSDVDLIFAFPEAGKTKGGPKSIDNEDFFSRLCRRLIKIIGGTTSDGFVFRVDMRLRPYGENGPIVMSFDAMEDYYQRQGREWERYAWIKARVLAGDKRAGVRLLSILRPFVYRKYLDYGVFESLRDLKQKISLEVRRKGLEGNIKLGRGGIREIEFFCQIFQLTRGGVTRALQLRRIQSVFPVLASEKYVSREICNELLEAYVFLRNVEHRLQEFSDQQTHDLPSEPVGRERLSASMGFSDWLSFETKLRRHMKSVHDHFKKLLGPIEPEESEGREKKILNELSGVWKTLDRREKELQMLLSAGFEDPEKVARILSDLHNDPATRSLSNEGRMRLDKLIPLILKEVGGSENSVLVLNRIVDLVKTIERRTNYLAFLLENPSALVRLVKLADASPWIVSFLSRYPVVLDELLYPHTLYSPPERDEIEKEIRKKLKKISPSDLESQMIELCIFRRVNTLRVASADVTGALPVMRVSDYLTEIAETVLNEVLDLAWKHLVAKHGTPACLLDGRACDRGFLVVAYGKLGGIELGYGSDLDLVFLHAAAEGKTENSAFPVENAHFFSRLGQRIIHILTAPTPAGVLYETDMRLRPDGSSGILVVNIESFKEYQDKKAWTWEHQALIKARAICGEPRLKRYFEEIRQEILAIPREKTVLQEEVRSMRNRMREELSRPESDLFDIKQDPGGLVDIEFLVQYLVLQNAHEYIQLTKWTDIVRLLQTLTETGIIDVSTGSFLKEAYLTYRASIHRLTLQEKPAKVPIDSFNALRERVIKVWSDFL